MRSKRAAKIEEHVGVEEQVQRTNGVQRIAAAPSFRPDARVQENGREKAVDFAFLEDGLRQIPTGPLYLPIQRGREGAEGEERDHDGQGGLREERWGAAQREAQVFAGRRRGRLGGRGRAFEGVWAVFSLSLSHVRARHA